MNLFEYAERNANRSEMPEIKNASGKRKKMLELLKSGPLSTYQAERAVHRGQATIGSLRSDGHLIDLKKLNGIDHYVYRGHSPRVKVTPSIKSAYYASPHWRSTARARKGFDGFICQQCGSDADLETHHWRYHLFAESVTHDLITFCHDCHKNIHEAVSGSILHFPKHISSDELSRIRGNGNYVNPTQ